LIFHGDTKGDMGLLGHTVDVLLNSVRKQNKKKTICNLCLLRQCDCNSFNTTCQCGNGSREHLLSITAKFTTISAIIASPDGVLNIADQVHCN